MTLTVLVLAVLASWSLTQLATRDEITTVLRLRLRRALRRNRHSIISCPPGATSMTYRGVTVRPGHDVCRCGYTSDVPVDMQEHVGLARAGDPSWTYRLVTCPWCVSAWISAAVGVTAWFWGHTAAWQIGAFAVGARVIAGAGVVHLGPPPDANEDVADD